MRIKTLFPGFKNSQKIRFVIDGFIMHCTIQDAVFGIGRSAHGAALADALQKLAYIRTGKGAAEQSASGIAITAFNGVQVQVDLC